MLKLDIRDICRLLVLCIVAVSALVPLGSHAVIEIEVTKGGENAIPIAIVPFGGNDDSLIPEDIAQIVADDLFRSGQFEPIARENMVARPVSGQRIQYSNWNILGVDYVAIGGVRRDGDGFTVEAQLFDIIQQTLMSGIRFKVSTQSLRNAAHQIADDIYQQILGIRGAFNTQIAYVSASGPRGSREYRLELSDADGEDPQPMLISPRPVMSPSWAPDGVRIAYVSFENRDRSAIYVQNRLTGQRTRVVSRDGINGAPAWSPDGNRLAVVLSESGNPDIYIVNVGSSQLTRVTENDAIDTEPVWVDDDTLVFTSDRSGGPQLYEISAEGGRAKRLTFEGNYNANAAVSPDGATIALVHGYSGGYQIALLERDTGLFRALTDGSLDESPSFAPNGQMIIFATERNGDGTLGAVSIDGSVIQSLTLSDGDVREPSWSPFSN